MTPGYQTDSSGNEAGIRRLKDQVMNGFIRPTDQRWGIHYRWQRLTSNHASKFYLWLAKTTLTATNFGTKTLSAELVQKLVVSVHQQTKDDGYIIASTTPEVLVESAAA